MLSLFHHSANKRYISEKELCKQIRPATHWMYAQVQSSSNKFNLLWLVAIVTQV